MADWQAIKTEYITTQTSYRKLAEKYGIHYKVISERGKDEGWVELRSQHRDKTLTKTLDKISQQEANRAAKIHSVADKLLLKIEAMVDSEDALSEKGIRALTAAVKDLKEIQSVRSDLDRQEQEARIANLRKQAEKDEDKTEDIEVVFIGGEEAWHG
jgi:transcriptional regulator of heat shock response